MKEFAEMTKVLLILAVVGLIACGAYRVGTIAHTEYQDKNFQRDKELRDELSQEERRRETARLEEANVRKAQSDAQLQFTKEQNRREELRLQISNAELDRTKKELELKVQQERSAKIGLELEKAVQLNVEKAAALKVTVPTWTFTLKDGTVIKTTRCMEMEREWTIKNDKGELVTIAKDTIQSVR